MAFFCVYFKGLTCYQSLRSPCKVCRPTVDTAVIASFGWNRWNGTAALGVCAHRRDLHSGLNPFWFPVQVLPPSTGLRGRVPCRLKDYQTFWPYDRHRI